jgi:glycosyltransferase involved in cell wall biosynthesis
MDSHAAMTEHVTQSRHGNQDVAHAQPEFVSVVMCTRNRPDLIARAVSSVLDNDHARFNLIVVDQSDDDQTGATVRALGATHANLRYVHTPTPGLSRAYNIGVRATTGTLIAFTDDDCAAPNDWITSIARAFSNEPDAEMLYGQVLLPESLRDHPEQVPTLPIARPARLSKREGFRIFGMGANFALRRSLFERIGGFDEILGGGAPLRSSQDFDFQYRAYLAGAVILLRPEVAVDHYGVRTPAQWPATHRAYGIGDGAFYFKHVRCGDSYALRLLVQRLAWLAAREALNGLRRKNSFSNYFRGCLVGIRDSLSYRVDRQARLYRHSEAS